jgi:hypothetical protein
MVVPGDTAWLVVSVSVAALFLGGFLGGFMNLPRWGVLGGWSPSEYQVESVRFPLVMGFLPTASSTTTLLVPFCTSSVHFSRLGGASGGL